LTVIEAKAQREAIMEERQRIAREFHDTLEQELAGLSLRLDAALPRVADEKAHDLLDQQRRLLGRLQTDTRDFVWDLRDVSRQDAPLDAALRSLVEHLQVNTTVPLTFESNTTELKVPALVQHHLLRITREAVNNALKYAQARSVRVLLARDEHAGSLTLTIADDGKGFAPASAQALDGHFGIRGMQERAKKINASLEVDSKPGEGARVNVLLHVNGL
jgi:signal transduction histidine kinase